MYVLFFVNHSQVGCGLEDNIVRVRTSPGRNLRLLIILKPWFQYLEKNTMTSSEGAFLFENSLHQCLSLGLVEFIDAMEERGLAVAHSYENFVALSAKGEIFSHLNPDPSWQWGMTAGSLPQPHKNQAPRSVLASAMMKQTFSSVTNPYRINTLSHCLDYPQRPLSQTRLTEDFQLFGVAIGENVPKTVFMSESSIEDAWERNKDANNRGLLQTSLIRRYVMNIKANALNNTKGAVLDRFGKPGKDCINKQDANHDKIMDDGLPGLGTSFEADDILMGRYKQDILSNGELGVKIDKSMSIRDERGVVQSTKRIVRETGYVHQEVVLHSQCMNEVGDKFASRHGQKGTVGTNRKQYDMIFSIVTGIISVYGMNPLGELSRMTHADINENDLGVAAVIVGMYIEATGFAWKHKRDQWTAAVGVMLKRGFLAINFQTYINGKTGIMTEPLVTGLTYIAPLAHLVANKIHARDHGPVQAHTRQPDAGRARGGGLRYGAMEYDATIANGCPRALLDRVKKSDAYYLPVCWTCGTISEADRRGYKYCRSCGTGEAVTMCHQSYSNKVMHQDLMSLHIWMKLLRDDKPGLSETTTAEAMVVDDYYKLTALPKPEPWEFAKYGLAEHSFNLHNKLNHIKLMQKEEARKQAEEQQAAAKLASKKLVSTKRKLAPPVETEAEAVKAEDSEFRALQSPLRRQRLPTPSPSTSFQHKVLLRHASPRV